MKFALKPLASLNGLVLAAVLATASASVMAQTAPAAPMPGPTAAGRYAGMHGERMGRHDPAKRQAWIAKRLAELKARLQVTPAQESAWTAFAAAMPPPAPHARPTPEQRAEFAKLSTPERIDKMRALRTQRMTEMSAAMDQRGEAIKTFYATLSPEQQKTFDAERQKRERHGARGDRDRY
ncbi:MAG: Spy/CpxP family protein refolding chaperone [Polaromonas sp.]